MNQLAIDPGVNGGIAVQYEDGRVEVHKIPGEIYLLKELFERLSPAKALVESQGVSGRENRYKLMQHGERYGIMLGVLFGVGIGWHKVAPQKWQRAMGLIVKGSGGFSSPDREAVYKDKKARAKRMASELFPEQKVHHWNADALLILYYATKGK